MEELGKFHVEAEHVLERMNQLKDSLGLHELMYLSTCNRVEFMMVFPSDAERFSTADFFQKFHPDFTEEEVERYSDSAKAWVGINAVNHLIEVASSLDSMVLGEREIITQVKDAYDFAAKNGLAGDMLRIILKQTIETAKRIFTETEIARKSVSVVSIAFHELEKLNPPKNSRILVVGAGATNMNMCRFLVDNDFTKFKVYNRNVDNARPLAELVNSDAFPLSEIDQHEDGFDILVTCTGAAEPVITEEIYHQLKQGEKNDKIIIDLAVPNDVEPEVISNNPTTYISVASLKKISENNLMDRRKELIKVRHLIYESLEEFKELFKLRQVEIQMRAIPEKVKDIRFKAVNEVFSKEIEELDDEAKATLEKVLNYMEKKYVSVPMLVAKQLAEQKNSTA